LLDAVAAVTFRVGMVNDAAATLAGAISWSKVRSTVVALVARPDTNVGAGTAELSAPGVCAARSSPSRMRSSSR
jgi:hypothetical protein